MTTENILSFDWSSQNRAKEIEKAKQSAFDLIIIGGGMTGAGIAREAALRGLSFALLDKNDFAFGTSSRSSKLAHGGMRYLANYEFKIVRESTTERNWLRVHFPNLVRPLAFNFYSYENYMYSPKKVKVGMQLYDFLSNTFSKFKNYQKYKILSAEEFSKLEPKIRKEKLVMGGYYYDTNVDDARLTLETIKESVFMAEAKSIALNYCKVTDFIIGMNGKVEGVNVEDALSGDKFEVKGTQVVNATGIWNDDLLHLEGKNSMIRPTKGVHLILLNERLGNTQAFGLQSPRDKRFYFILKREKYTVIGTTDTDYKENLDKPVCTKEDCDYLLEGVNFLFPDAHLTEKDLISTYAGIRPLVVDPNSKTASDVSRKHVIHDSPNGLVSLIGGKLTIYRLMAEDLLYHLMKTKGLFSKVPKNQCKKGYSKKPFLVGLTRQNFDKEYSAGVKAGTYIQLDEDRLEHLHRQYGKQAFEILKSMKKEPQKAERLIPENQFTTAEIEWICDHEFAPTLLDMVIRRTEIWMYVHHTKAKEIAEKVGKIMKVKYGWNEDRTQKEVQSFVDYTKAWVWF